MKPARISGGTGVAPGIAVNRRERDGKGGTILGWNKENFIDEEVPTIRIDGHDGVAIATLVGFGCHPVVLGGEVPFGGPDFIGELRRRVELLRGGVCIFLQGAAGNVLPLEAFFDHPGPEIAMGERLGLEAVHAVADRDPRVIEIKKIDYGSVTPISLYRRQAVSPQPSQPVSSRRKVLNLPLNPAMTVPEMEKELATRSEDYLTKEKAGAGRDLLNPMRYHILWLTEILRMAARGPLPETIEGEIWAARLGDSAIVGTPGELFTEIGAEVRRRSPFDTTIFAGYCQGVLGYVSTPEEYQFGGYEPTVAQRGYGHPAPFSPAASRMLIEESVALLESLKADIK
jgi:neutral ceramidase